MSETWPAPAPVLIAIAALLVVLVAVLVEHAHPRTRPVPRVDWAARWRTEIRFRCVACRCQVTERISSQAEWFARAEDSTCAKCRGGK